MRGFSNSVLSCLERERLEEELSNLSRLRQLTDRWTKASRRLRHGTEHGGQRSSCFRQFGVGTVWS